MFYILHKVCTHKESLQGNSVAEAQNAGGSRTSAKYYGSMNTFMHSGRLNEPINL